MPTLTIDNQAVSVREGATVLEAARALGIEIPTLCWREGCEPSTSCLVCVVRVNGAQRLVPSCATVAAEGMVVESESAEVRAARRTALELLLADHAGDCFAPCELVCPAHLDIPRMMDEVQQNRLEDAIVSVKKYLPFPGVLGYVCPELCEKGCRRRDIDGSLTICRMHGFVAEQDLKRPTPYLPEKKPPSGKRVAIVGSGPAGLSAAWFLLQEGHGVCLFDDRPEPGGMLRYGIPESRLPRYILDGEIEIIRRLGAEFRMGVKIGRDRSVDDLLSEFDAVLLAFGQDGAAAHGGAAGLKADRNTLQTERPGVFAAGAAVTPYRHAVRAVADGKQAAVSIDQHLRGKTVEVRRRFAVKLGVLDQVEWATLNREARQAPRIEPRAAAQYSHSELAQEADRCVRCGCDSLAWCALHRFSHQLGANPMRFRMNRKPMAIIDSHPYVLYEPGKCIACGLCVQITERAREPLGLTWVGRGFDIRVDVPFGGTLAEALRTVADEVCLACPTGALRIKPGMEPAAAAADT